MTMRRAGWTFEGARQIGKTWQVTYGTTAPVGKAMLPKQVRAGRNGCALLALLVGLVLIAAVIVGAAGGQGSSSSGPRVTATGGILPRIGVVGSTIRLTVTVTNDGPGDIGQLALGIDEQGLDGFVLMTTSPTGQATTAGGRRELTFGPLAAGQSATYLIDLSPLTAGQRTLTMHIEDATRSQTGTNHLTFSDGAAALVFQASVLAR